MTQIHLFSPPALFKAKMSAGFGGGGFAMAFFLFVCSEGFYKGVQMGKKI